MSSVSLGNDARSKFNQTAGRKKILFVVEALTFAHVVRSTVLANVLRDANYEVYFAFYPGQYGGMVAEDLRGIETRHLKEHVSLESFISRMNEHKSPWNIDTLETYIGEETQLFEEIRPDLVIGDLRCTLSVSCAKFGVPYINLVNAIWSPFVRQRMVYPDSQLSRTLGVTLYEFVCRLIQPFAFRSICRPLNVLRSRYGLPAFRDIFEFLSAGDLNLYLDPPELFEAPNLPGNHKFIGPVLHSMRMPLPAAVSNLDSSQSIVFVSLGSSGSIDCLPEIVQGLRQLPAFTVVATSGRANITNQGPRVIACEFLPAREVLRRSSLMISNGGSPMSYLALSEGVPVLAICSNMDQHLTSQAIAEYGAGIVLRSEHVNAKAAKDAIELLLRNPQYKERAQACSKFIKANDTLKTFEDAVSSFLDDGANAICACSLGTSVQIPR